MKIFNFNNLFYYVIVQDNSTKNDEKLSLCSPITPVPVSKFFSEVLSLHSQIVGLSKTCRRLFLTQQIRFSDLSFSTIASKKLLKINIIWLFIIKRPLKTFLDRTLLDNNVTHLLKKLVSKNVYNRRIITLPKSQVFDFHGRPGPQYLNILRPMKIYFAM